LWCSMTMGACRERRRDPHCRRTPPDGTPLEFAGALALPAPPQPASSVAVTAELMRSRRSMACPFGRCGIAWGWLRRYGRRRVRQEADANERSFVATDAFQWEDWPGARLALGGRNSSSPSRLDAVGCSAGRGPQIARRPVARGSTLVTSMGLFDALRGDDHRELVKGGVPARLGVSGFGVGAVGEGHAGSPAEIV
jgi:hypothetical protein